MRTVRLSKHFIWLAVMANLASMMPCLAQAQEWAQVNGGSFEVAPAVLSEVKETLRDYVAPKLGQPRDWGAYLVQYRSVYV